VDKRRFLDFLPVTVDPAVLAAFRERPDGALLGSEFLRRNRGKYPWRVGETYALKELGGVSITFMGTFHSDNAAYNTIIFAGRRYLQEVDGLLGMAHQIYVKIDDPRFARAVAAAIDQELPAKFPVQTTTVDQRAFLTMAVEDLVEIVAFSRVILLVVLGVLLAAVANTISMATRDRVQEIGTLRSLGFRRAHIIGIVLGESLLLAAAGGVLGIGLAWCGLNLQNAYYGVRGLNILIRVTPLAALLALGLSLAVGAAGGLLPAWGASRLEIVRALRRVD
jgi:putative ABC transport system permease protein